MFTVSTRKRGSGRWGKEKSEDPSVVCSHLEDINGFPNFKNKVKNSLLFVTHMGEVLRILPKFYIRKQDMFSKRNPLLLVIQWSVMISQQTVMLQAQDGVRSYEKSNRHN